MTTATLRPNATISAADSRTGGAASDHASVNDDSDATYVTDDDTVTFGLDTVALSSAVTKQVRIRWRGRADASVMVYNVSLLTGSTIVDQHALQVLSTTLGTTTFAYVPVTLSQAEVDALEVRWQSPTGADAFRVYEAYVDLVYVAQPVTAVTAVTDPYTLSTIVPIEWTNTLDSDGGAQTRYEIKVFTAAQVAAPGFDPDTSTPYFTTDEVVSAATTDDVGPLENADTYTVYVRVAQTVNGAKHWSDWATDTFTLSVTTADVDTITATADNANAAIDVSVTWDALSAGWETIEVQRSIDGGATWVDVRGAAYVATPDSGATAFTITDYEVPNGTAADYRARATYLSSGLPITGAWVQTSSSATWSSDVLWLKAPDDPTLNTDAACLAGRTPYRRNRRTGVFQVLGAAAPVTVSDVRSLRAGTLVLETITAAEAAAVEALLEGSSVILVQHPPSMDIPDKYVAVISDDELFRSDVADSLIRAWSVEYVEVSAPADPNSGR